MRKIFLIALFALCAIEGFSQRYTPFQGWGFSARRLKADSVLMPPSDTVVSKDGIAKIGGKLFVGDGTKWAQAGGDTTSLSNRIDERVKYTDTALMLSGYIRNGQVNVRFTSNVTVNGLSTDKLGVWANGETIPLEGKPYDSLPYILATKCVPPTYTSPTAGISASPSNGSYERGTNLGTVTLSSTFTQNDGGAATTTTFFQNGSPLGGNTTTISSLTTTQSFYVNRAYSQGACKTNNCGVIDCTGRINAGSVNSGTISFVPFDKRYWGFVNSQSPSNSDILALSQDNNGATGAITLTNQTPSGSQYFVYFTKGSVSSITVNGFPATSAFTITTYTVTNAQGFSSSYTYVYSNNLQTGTISSIVIN